MLTPLQLLVAFWSGFQLIAKGCFIDLPNILEGYLGAKWDFTPKDIQSIYQVQRGAPIAAFLRTMFVLRNQAQELLFVTASLTLAGMTYVYALSQGLLTLAQISMFFNSVGFEIQFSVFPKLMSLYTPSHINALFSTFIFSGKAAGAWISSTFYVGWISQTKDLSKIITFQRTYLTVFCACFLLFISKTRN